MTSSELNGLVLPDGLVAPRDVPERVKNKLPDGWRETYDFNTLFYDAFYVPRARAVCLICPALLNFRDVLKSAEISIDGRPARIRTIFSQRNYAEVWIGSWRPAEAISIAINGQSFHVPISHQDSDTFLNANVIMTMCKDGKIEWIVDWLNYHVKVHRANAVLFFNNNSTAYSKDDLIAALSGIAGLNGSIVIDVPYSYGVPSVNAMKFLQKGIWNTARLRFLSRARAVLPIDVDELVSPIVGSDIFSRTTRSVLGYNLFRGYWRWPHPDAEAGDTRHRDHYFRLSNDDVGRTKYCIAPRGVLGVSQWGVHQAVAGFMKPLFFADDVLYWHCRNISTNWKYNRSRKASPELRSDDETRVALERVFNSEI